MSLKRFVALTLALLVPLTAFLAFAAASHLAMPHPWSKQTHSATHAPVRLPSGITTAPGALVVLPLVGRLIAAAPMPAASIALRPPFIPPRV
jgi:uncharacterized protein YcnI